MVDAEGVLVFADPEFAEILGEAPEGYSGAYSEFLTEPEILKTIDAALESQRPQSNEFVMSVQDKQKTLSFHVRPYARDSQQGWLLKLADLTALKRLEAIEREFITNVSHELRTPLTSIKMAAESLQMGAIGNQKLKDRFLSNIQREADRLTRLVNELLVLANVQDAKTTLHPSSFDLDGLLDDVMSTMQPHSRVNDIDLIGNFDDNLPVMVADRDRLLQVLINLVDNAIKCNRPNGSVTLEAKTEAQKVRFKVIDTGIGIPSLDVHRIFDRFFRVDKARSRVTGGTGLGLSIVKDIIEAHGGSIDVESTVNVGTTFIIELPIKAIVAENNEEGD